MNHCGVHITFYYLINMGFMQRGGGRGLQNSKVRSNEFDFAKS